MSVFSNQSEQFLNNKIKGKIVTVLWITLVWTLIGVHRFFEGYVSVMYTDCLAYTIELGDGLLKILLTIIPASLMIGSSLVFIWDRWLRNMAYLKAMFFILLFYTTVFYIIYPIDYFFQVVNTSNSLSEKDLIKTVLKGVFSLKILPTYLFWLAITLLTILFLLIRDTFGPVTFVNFLKGKYLRPKREERIFMFMDLKSSTTIAERLGEERYFNFLNDTFSTVTPGIMATEGEIYQYVGDEIVISWITKKGLNRANCIRCYDKTTALLKDRAAYFDKECGTQPQFKAGLHYGHVVTGEMGIVKREIVYSGDVLNTASRIQSLCNEMNTAILISRKLINQIDVGVLHKKIKSVGTINLRGKQENVELVTLVHMD